MPATPNASNASKTPNASKTRKVLNRPTAPDRTRARRLYQPRLPLPDDRIRPSAGSPSPGATAEGPSWRLDEKTRRAGRRGVAEARAALAGAARRGPDRRADAA